MKDEIIDNIKADLLYCYKDGYSTKEEYERELDYITNLQNENMKYDQCLTELTDNYKDLQKELTNLQEEKEIIAKDFKEVSEKYFFTKSRNEKAIEDIDLLISGRYFKNNTGYMAQPCCNVRLEIIKNDLQGKSDE